MKTRIGSSLLLVLLLTAGAARAQARPEFDLAFVVAVPQGAFREHVATVPAAASTSGSTAGRWAGRRST